jgi:hypothetical protein
MKASKNIFVVVGSVVVVLLLVGAAMMLGVGAWRLTRSETNLKRLKGQWRQFYEQGNPFPSRENVLKEKKNNETIEFWFTEVMKELRKDQIVPDMGKNSASLFGDDLGRERDKMRALAEARGVSIPGEFAFGFDRYLAGRGAVLPTTENVPYLRQQLETIERLYNLIVESDVKAIESIERDPFDAVTEETAPKPSVSMPGTGTEGRRAMKPGTMQGDALYGKLHYAVTFKTRENIVWDVLNRLAKQDMIIVVTSVQMDGEGLDVVKAALPTSAAKDEGTAVEATTRATPMGGLLAKRAAERAAAAAAEKEKAKGKPKEKEADSRIPSRQERLICGPSKAAPARVKIELDVYRFKEE